MKKYKPLAAPIPESERPSVKPFKEAPRLQTPTERILAHLRRAKNPATALVIARRLGLSVSTVRRVVRRGFGIQRHGPKILVGGSRVYEWGASS